MGWVTNLKRNPFEQARLKLTGYYLVAVFFIVAIFSIVLMNVVEKNLRDTLDDSIQDVRARQEIFHKTSDDIQTIVMVIDGVLLLIVGGLGYFLAGKTLLPIKKNLEAQKRFTADASHDLRTPLTIMKTEMEVALENKHSDSGKYKEVILSSLEEIATMSSLVEDLLALARSEGLQHKEECIAIDYVACLTPLVERVRVQAKSKNIAVTLQTVPASIFVNEQNFMRAIQNVLNNAVYYTPSHGKIDIVLSKKAKYAILTISDTGVGISNEDLSRIFDRFYKASHSRNDQTGSGLGLSIAKEFIERYNGTIKVTSVLGKGTVVTITVPEA
jgi:signal transduction histidine kinase